MPTAAGGGIWNPNPPALRQRLPASTRRGVPLGLLLCLCTGAGAGRESAGADSRPALGILPRAAEAPACPALARPGWCLQPVLRLSLRGGKDRGAHSAHASKSRRAQQKTRVAGGTLKGEMQVHKCAFGAH
jgi:hypothetical protein